MDDDRVLDLLVEWDEARQRGETREAEELCPDDPALQAALRRRIEQRRRVAQMIEPAPSEHPNELSRDALTAASHGSRDLSDTDDKSSEKLPEHIGRYRRERLLGRGGFGLVYLAHDEQLNRRVAIKVPHPQLVSRPEEAEAYRTEARSVASLDHPHIVPVFDVGSTEQCPCFVVSKYIEGTSLAKRLKESRLSFTETASVLAIVAEALHHAHKQGFVHRDVKPANILLSQSGEPFVIDFGLALREQSLEDGRRFAGTPAYMSPEQARGEAHRVDGRSDIFSLGVVLYELLTGRRPFHADTDTELLSQVVSTDPKPPRQIDDRVPKELERICLKSLSKRATERYTTAKDFADDLRQYLFDRASGDSERPTPRSAASLVTPSAMLATPTTTPTSGGRFDSDRTGAPIVPKGLRSFDEHDADFFLELLPGPRDRHGLPESIRLWKRHIEETDANQTFSVGLLYGPSGSGKSSLIKAGLLPRLSEQVTAIYLEATPLDTESRLLNALRRRCPELANDQPLKETLAALRRRAEPRLTATPSACARRAIDHEDAHADGVGVKQSRKILIVLDQFEQWLHANRDQQEAELIAALRQCDGEHVQCVVMVRDDFWMAATRFMRELEVQLVEGFNSNAVDLFPVRHAQKVLTAFGRAFGALPMNAEAMTPEQHEFVKQAINSLAEDGHVISVRLALFAEMLKDKLWVPATLKEVGGSEGVGVAFLESAFGGSYSPPAHRVHQRAVRAVLARLLPEAGVEIKGHVRSRSELLDASGYANRPRELDDLLRILDTELRLITPVDASNETHDVVATFARTWEIAEPHVLANVATTHPSGLRERSYQLTHDYLVPSLRDWLTRKQRETRRGRAELQLAERSAVWNAKPDNRLLPTLPEYIGIRLLTRRAQWTEPQRRMMSKAGRVHFTRWTIALVGLLAVIVPLQQFVVRRDQERVQSVIDAVQTSRVEAVPAILLDLKNLPRLAALREIRSRQASSTSSQRLRLAFAEAELGEPDVPFLCSQIPTVAWDEADFLMKSLRHVRSESLTTIRSAADICQAEQNWAFKSRLAIVSLHLGDLRLATDMCQIEERPDPVQRTVFVEQFAAWQGDIAELAAIVQGTNDAAFRSALCMGLTSIPGERLTTEIKSAWQPLFADWFEHAPDAVTHSASGLPFFYWALEITEPEVTSKPSDDRDWFYNSLRMTLVRTPPSGSAREAQHVEPPLYLSDREVAQAQFQRFLDDADYPTSEKPTKLPPIHQPNPFFPMHSVNWFHAVQFCNWLNHVEGYEPNYIRTGTKHSSGQDEWRLAPKRPGYRLPPEARWEVAAHAGTETPFSFGAAAFSFRYANFNGTGMLPCAIKLPNGWGLFDMHGNVSEWCHQSYHGNEPRDPIVRGGNYIVQPSQADVWQRTVRNPLDTLFDLGFRVAFVPPIEPTPPESPAADRTPPAR